MSSVYMLFGTLLALGVLVTIHEYGHFWVARKCGVKVLRFSVGFGTPLLRWHDRHGTEFVIAAIPLGGYVKMLDSREGELTEQQQAYAFNHKSVQQRIAIVAAGPVANFLLAFVFFWCLAMLGTQEPRPIIGQVLPQSLAEQAGLKAGLEISAIDGNSVVGWSDINIQLIRRAGETGTLRIDAQVPGDSIAADYSLQLQEWQKGAEDLNPLLSLGLVPWRPAVEALLTQLDEQGPAYAAGLREQDLIVAIDEQSMDSWHEVVRYVQAKPNQQVRILVERQHEQLLIPVNLTARGDERLPVGYLGAGASSAAWPEEMLVHTSFGPVSAIAEGAKRTWLMSSMTLASIKKMLFGELSAKNLSGPISIAKVAGASAESGLRSFLNFLAYLSISLGVLNLLPIPVLDGGHLLFYTVEWVRGKPVSEKIQAWGMQIGIALVMCVMFFAVFNDITRL